MRTNIITAIAGDKPYIKTDSVFQYDYGLKLVISGVTLPESYDVHFSNTNKPSAKTVTGDSSGVLIPDEYLLNGEDVHAWVYLHTEGLDDDGETVYHIQIPVVARAAIAEEQITPVQHNVIEEALEEMAEAVAETQANVTHYPYINEENYWMVYDAEHEQFVNTGVKADGSEVSGKADLDVISTDYASLIFPVISGQGCIHEGVRYKAIQDIPTSEEWNVAHWEVESIEDSLGSVKSEITNKLDAPSTAGTNGQVLTSNGSGGQSWQNPSGGAEIDDTAGAGDTDKAWSADKIVTEIQQIIVSGGVPIDDTAGQSDTNKLWSAGKTASILEYERTEVVSRNLNVTPYDTSRTDRQVTFAVRDDNSVDITGTASGGWAYLLPGANDLHTYKWQLPAGTYFLSGGISSARPALAYLYTNKTDTTAVKTYQDNGSGKKFTTDTDLWCCVGFLISDSNETNINIKLQLEAGTSATTYVSPWPTISESSIFDDIDAEMDAMQEDIDSLKKPEPGTTQYTGERITLEPDTVQTHKCDLQLWKEFVSADLPSGATVENIYHKNQAMTAYGGYMFFFSQDGGGAVVDMETKTIISTFSYPSPAPTMNHQNSAQFSNHFHTAGDEFPLLYVSRCGNSNWSSETHELDDILVFRVTRSSTTFTFTLINTIRLNTTSYGMSWGIDNVTHLLYAQAPIVSNFQYPTGNKIGFWVIKEPTLMDILSGTPIVLNPDDAVAHFITDYVTIQGCCVHYGKLYQGVTVPGVGTNNVVVYDSFKGLAITTVLISAGWEIQGVVVYDGKLYTTNKSDTALRVYEVEF